LCVLAMTKKATIVGDVFLCWKDTRTQYGLYNTVDIYCITVVPCLKRLAYDCPAKP
jgi:hypothetical protein